MKALSILLLLIISFCFTSFLQIMEQKSPGISDGRIESRSSRINPETFGILPVQGIEKLEIPQLKPYEAVITHTGYSLSYNEAFEQANWVAYELTSAETKAVVKRYNRFIVDPAVSSGTANSKDYAKKGFDTGHLAPARDMAWSATAMKECFYYSNMSPQSPGFNRGIWKRGEEQVRSWAREYGSIYIVTGPILTEGLPTIGPDRVAVPVLFYKVILNYTQTGHKGLGLLMKNESSGESLRSFAVSIDSVEKITGIDFFPRLPDEQEKRIESHLDLGDWSWNSNPTEGSKTNPSNSIQCSGNRYLNNRKTAKSINHLMKTTTTIASPSPSLMIVQ